MESRDRLGLGFFYVVNPRRSRAFPQPRVEPRQLIARSHSQHFHAAIWIVAHPASDAQEVRLALDKPAKANALDAAPHEKAARLDGSSFSG